MRVRGTKSFVFGAGASHSYTQSSTGIRPPLARDFFQSYRNLDIAADRFVRVGNIINYVRDTRGLNVLEFGQWDENIEDFLTEIDEKIGTKEAAAELEFGQLIQFTQAYDQMIYLFASVLNEIQNGPVCRNYEALCNSLHPGDALITFNWDTLLDRALFESGKWFPDDGYDLSFKSVFRDRWEDVNIAGSSVIKLIKLHGSTNWLMPLLTIDYRYKERRFANPTIDTNQRPIFCFQFAKKKYPTYHNRSKTGYQPFSYYYYPPDIPVRTDSQAPEGYTRISITATPDVPEYGTVREGGYPTLSMPLIIPPVRHKQYSLLGNTLDDLWKQAEQSIANCDQLVLIGYSFPVTDIRAWDMVERGILDRGSVLPVTIIDPYPKQLAEWLRQRYGEMVELEVLEMTFDRFCRTAIA